MRPFELDANQIHRFYRGGARIAAFRSLADVDDAAPEDWVGSTTSVHGDGTIGQSRLSDGALLAERIAADPEAFLGPEHVAELGAEPGVLVKLLDAGERLPLHLHPDEAFARDHLGSRFGKTEAWIILEADEGAAVHVGFSRTLDEHELERLVLSQDVSAMVDAMNRLPVRAGDSIYVPGGVPHVIGEGILLLELQEASDFSILLEWGRASEAEAFLGLPRELALRSVTRTALTGELERLKSRRGASFFPDDADRFFRADRLGDGSVLEASFSIVLGVGGEGVLEADDGEPFRVRRGTTVLVPYAAGTTRLSGAVDAIRCRPRVVC